MLLDSFAFVSTALAKFPAIFNIEEERIFFHMHEVVALDIGPGHKGDISTVFICCLNNNFHNI